MWLPLADQLQGDRGRKENCRQMDACMATQGEMAARGGSTKVIKASSLGNWGSGVEQVNSVEELNLEGRRKFVNQSGALE